jgi:two-component system, OmpR family, alkaline phosphatase synthesis response regulator PhoP
MSKRILLCDDEIHILRAVEFKLKQAGFEVETTCDGQEAWEAIQRDKPDLLIADYYMPKLNGIELVRRMRGNPQTADIPVLILTCRIYTLSPEMLTEDLRILKVIAKPFSPRELLKEVNRALEEAVVQA